MQYDLDEGCWLFKIRFARDIICYNFLLREKISLESLIA